MTKRPVKNNVVIKKSTTTTTKTVPTKNKKKKVMRKVGTVAQPAVPVAIPQAAPVRTPSPAAPVVRPVIPPTTPPHVVIPPRVTPVAPVVTPVATPTTTPTPPTPIAPVTPVVPAMTATPSPVTPMTPVTPPAAPVIRGAAPTTPPVTPTTQTPATPVVPAAPVTTASYSLFERLKSWLSSLSFSAITINKGFVHIVLLILGICFIFWFFMNREVILARIPSVGTGNMLVVSNGVMTSSRPRSNIGIPSVTVEGSNNSVQVIVTGDASPVYFGAIPNQSTSTDAAPRWSIGEDIRPRPVDLAPGLEIGPHILISATDQQFDLAPGQKAVVEKNGDKRLVLEPYANWPRLASFNTETLRNGDTVVTSTSSDVQHLRVTWR